VANPQIVIAVTLNHTSGGSAGFGGPVAAPVFREVAMDALRMLDVPKDLPEGASGAAEGATKVARDSTNDFSNKAGLFVQPGQRAVSSVTPPPVREGASASAEASSSDRRPFFNQESQPVLTANAQTPGGRRTPDFIGKSVRFVLEESMAAGFPVETHGEGLARSQDPPPGTPLRPHALVRVQFGR